MAIIVYTDNDIFLDCSIESIFDVPVPTNCSTNNVIQRMVALSLSLSLLKQKKVAFYDCLDVRLLVASTSMKGDWRDDEHAAM
jgi:hypothetical protein